MTIPVSRVSARSLSPALRRQRLRRSSRAAEQRAGEDRSVHRLVHFGRLPATSRRGHRAAPTTSADRRDRSVGRFELDQDDRAEQHTSGEQTAAARGARSWLGGDGFLPSTVTVDIEPGIETLKSVGSTRPPQHAVDLQIVDDQRRGRLVELGQQLHQGLVGATQRRSAGRCGDSAERASAGRLSVLPMVAPTEAASSSMRLCRVAAGDRVAGALEGDLAGAGSGAQLGRPARAARAARRPRPATAAAACGGSPGQPRARRRGRQAGRRPGDRRAPTQSRPIGSTPRSRPRRPVGMAASETTVQPPR